jgi:hypothetical protein
MGSIFVFFFFSELGAEKKSICMGKRGGESLRGVHNDGYRPRRKRKATELRGCTSDEAYED